MCIRDRVVSGEELFDKLDRDRELAREWIDQTYDKDRFASEFSQVLEQAAKYGIPVYCGEYGCLSASNETQRYNWLKDMNETFESLGIARAVWCYREGPGGFGILSGTSTEPDQRMLDCLMGINSGL